MRFHRGLSMLLAAAACLGSASCSKPGQTIQGAGATFPAPLYKRWFLEYYMRHPDVRVNYQPIGSGAGIRKFTDGLTTFGASDAAMSPKEAKAFKKARGTEALLLPVTAGSIVLCYNLSGLDKPLQLSRKAYLQIFQGEITTWDDPVIAACNPGVTLPAGQAIRVVRRSDGSGTTYAFTNHLNQVAKSLKSEWKPGVGKSVVWPRRDMIGGRGNSGVAALIQQTPGAIGYLEAGYAELNHLAMAKLENKAGKFVKADLESSQAALKGVPLPPDFRIWLPDPAGEKAYPIVTYTWILAKTKYEDPKVAQRLKEVLRFCLTEGQKFSEKLGYIPLPPDIANEVLRAVERINAEESRNALALPR